MKETYGLDGRDAMAAWVLEQVRPQLDRATVIGLSGDLGAGKTTLVQSIAQTLGVTEQVQSPTFVIAKFYASRDPLWDQLIHIDAYRIENVAELLTLGWDMFLASPKTLICVEWPERIADILPPDVYRITLEHNEDARTLSYGNH